MRLRRSPRLVRKPWGRRALAFGALVALWLIPFAGIAAASPVTLIRTYDSDTRGLVYEVCRGTFEPPPTDPGNPAYCRGRAEYWSQERWQAYVRQTGEEQHSGKSKQKSSGDQGKKPPAPGGVATGKPPAGPQPSQSTIPYGGSLDPTSVLGITNPLCGEKSELTAEQARNCRSSHSPEAAYPVGNYGWDIHIEEGGFITSLFAPAVAFVLQIFSVVWLALLLILKGCLIVLGFTFSLSPFTSNHILREISGGLTRFYDNFTAPWLTTLMLILGGWALYNGIVRRKAGETLGGVASSLLMMLLALWSIHAPRETVGQVAEIVNSSSLVAVSAPTSGHVSRSVSSYNAAMASVWNQMTAVPFCAMDFSDVHWCLQSKPSKEAIEAAKKGVSIDEPFGQSLLKDLPEDEEAATRALNRRVQAAFGGAKTIADLYLRFSPGSGPRDALWSYYNGTGDDHIGLPLHIGPQIDIGGGTEGKNPEKVAMQGRSGLLPRMVLLVIFALGLIGGVLLLLWIAMKLVMATVSSFVLLLMAPIAMFFPAFGQGGRAAFVKWGTSLLGAVLAKLIFAALLGIVLLGSKVLGAGIGGSSPTLGLIATMSFWWAVFLNREQYLAIMQIDSVRDRSGSFYRTMAGGYVGYRFARAATNAIGRHRAERRDRAERQQEVQMRAGREGAEQELNTQARQRLEVAANRAEGREAGYSRSENEAAALRDDPEVQAYRQDPGSVSGDAGERAQRKADQLTALESELAAGRATSAADRQLLSRIRANEAAGLPRHGRAEIEGAKEAIRREVGLDADAPEHHWRAEAVGKDPRSGDGRSAIADSLERARDAVGTVSGARLDQVGVRRFRHAHGQRRPPSTIRQTTSEGGTPDGKRSPRRSSRTRSGLSR